MQKLAGRYNSDRIVQPAGRLVELLEQTSPSKPPSSPVIQAISDEIRALADSCARRSDDQGGAQAIGGRKPVYVCFEDVSQATSLAEQLNFFGIPAHVVTDTLDLNRAMHHRLPAALIVGVEFEGDDVNAAKIAQDGLKQPAPVRARQTFVFRHD